MFGGYIAKRMGLPVKEFIISVSGIVRVALELECHIPCPASAQVNANDVVSQLFNEAKMVKRELQPTISNAIDILVPYNIFRFLYYTAGSAALVPLALILLPCLTRLVLVRHASNPAKEDGATVKKWLHEFRAGRVDIPDKSWADGYRAVTCSDQDTLATIK